MTDPISAEQFLASKVRDAAKAWGQTIAAVFTAGGILTLLQGEAKFRNLQPWARWLGAGLLIIALAAAAFAIIRAFHVAWEEETDNPSNRLQRSVDSTVLALGALTAAALLLFLGPTEDAPKRFLVTFEEGKSVACGELVRRNDGLEVSEKPLVGVASVAAVEGCPDDQLAPTWTCGASQGYIDNDNNWSLVDRYP